MGRHNTTFRNLRVVDGGTRCEYRNMVWKPGKCPKLKAKKKQRKHCKLPSDMPEKNWVRACSSIVI
jgi:hypothetical protein